MLEEWSFKEIQMSGAKKKKNRQRKKRVSISKFSLHGSVAAWQRGANKTSLYFDRGSMAA